MSQLREEIFVCLDCESTGLDPREDRIIEIAASRFTFEKVLQDMESLINPECDIPKISQDIHKISKEMVLDQPKIKEILPDFLEMIDGYILVGHGIGFDIALIDAEAQRNQIPCNITKAPFIDTLRLARLYGESPINSLEKLRQHFNIAAEGAHRAMNDVMVNIEVFKYLSRSFKTTDSILKTLSKPIKLRTMPLGKHKGRRFEEIPIEYLRWAAKKDFDQDLLYSIRLELRNRKKGIRFEQSANPFSNL
jgi:DNA polymerase III subunit epsilon